jgi:riboflavin synthase
MCPVTGVRLFGNSAVRQFWNGRTVERSNGRTVVFTGIIESMGTVRELVRRRSGARAHIGAGAMAKTLQIGESIAVDGACLTVTGVKADGFTCDLSPETLSRTTLGALRAGMRVNLERPLRLGDRLGGHLVTGHVDGVGWIAGRARQGDGEFMRFRFPTGLDRLLVMKGSIAVDGISLTVAELSRNTFGVALIPHTLRATTLGGKRVGDPVNLEGDLMGKYVVRILGNRPGPRRKRGLDHSLLQEHGFA